jgi:hypothetical protein
MIYNDRFSNSIYYLFPFVYVCDEGCQVFLFEKNNMPTIRNIRLFNRVAMWVRLIQDGT